MYSAVGPCVLLTRLSTKLCFASSSLGNRSTIRYELAVSKYETRVSYHGCHHASNKDERHDNSEIQTLY